MPNPHTALVLRSNYETATQYLSAYMQAVVDRARQRGFSVVDLEGADATKSQFFDSLERDDPLLVVCAGHGNDSAFYAQNGEQVLAACQNDQVMSGREGIFKSCSVGVALGPSMVEKTARWFVGWRADYTFSYDDEAPSVLEDEIARPFMECIIQPALTRIDGGGPSQIYTATINKFNLEIGKLWNSDYFWAGQSITYLVHDRDNFMVSGIYTPAVLGVNPLVLIGSALGLLYFVGGLA